MDEFSIESVPETSDKKVFWTTYTIAMTALAVFLLVVFVLIFWSAIPRGEHTVETENESTQDSEAPSTTNETIQGNQSSTTENPTIESTTPINASARLNGRIFMVGEDGKYIRLAVESDGIYSIGITAETKIAQGESVLTPRDLKPNTEVGVDASRLSDTQGYDFIAQTIQVQPVAQKTIDERAAHLIEIGSMMSTEF
jgi:cytoskeletal protein RodZ